MTPESKQPLAVLVGTRLSSIEFVQDYVQLRFDGPCLTAITHPSIKVGDVWYKWESPGYRDMLCGRIAKTVRVASVNEGDEIRLEFEDQAQIAISLKPQDYCGAEAAIFDDGPQDHWVW